MGNNEEFKKGHSTISLILAFVTGLIIGAGGLWGIQLASKSNSGTPATSSKDNQTSSNDVQSAGQSNPESHILPIISSVDNTSSSTTPTNVELNGEQGQKKLEEIWKDEINAVAKQQFGLNKSFSESKSSEDKYSLITNEIPSLDSEDRTVIDSSQNRDNGTMTMSYNGETAGGYIYTTNKHNSDELTSTLQWTAVEGDNCKFYDNENKTYSNNDKYYTFEWFMDDERTDALDYIFPLKFDDDYFEQYAMGRFEPSHLIYDSKIKTAGVSFTPSNFTMKYTEESGYKVLRYSVELESGGYNSNFPSPNYSLHTYLMKYKFRGTMTTTIKWTSSGISSRDVSISSSTFFTTRAPGNQYRYVERSGNYSESASYETSYTNKTFPSITGFTLG